MRITKPLICMDKSATEPSSYYTEQTYKTIFYYEKNIFYHTPRYSDAGTSTS